eukprot:CAMPEP_0180108948 /NCGR_PEP_ID=MMETSP0985-20121206/34176_1 /TAXON_ID=483367 /ORGANISM="non described non described, Strain CCMP 2436" /LENGTH=216 /DNA_ID=CAMNT_0022046729 /DNA_START=1258 /DNA_END=1910 /DNA_ORIENTATION=-
MAQTADRVAISRVQLLWPQQAGARARSPGHPPAVSTHARLPLQARAAARPKQARPRATILLDGDQTGEEQGSPLRRAAVREHSSSPLITVHQPELNVARERERFIYRRRDTGPDESRTGVPREVGRAEAAVVHFAVLVGRVCPCDGHEVVCRGRREEIFVDLALALVLHANAGHRRLHPRRLEAGCRVASARDHVKGAPLAVPIARLIPSDHGKLL